MLYIITKYLKHNRRHGRCEIPKGLIGIEQNDQIEIILSLVQSYFTWNEDHSSRSRINFINLYRVKCVSFNYFQEPAGMRLFMEIFICEKISESVFIKIISYHKNK